MAKQEVKDKKVIITGANSGIGYEAAKVLAEQGAHVVLAVRNEERGNEAAQNIVKEHEGANISVMKLDLSDLASVKEFADAYKEGFDQLHILINNAGVMIPPYQKTKDGFELQFGGNHLGHFALTGHLLPMLKATPSARLVTLSSIAHRGASIDFDNLDGSKGYKAMKFYGQSKLANLLFAKELDNRLKRAGINATSVACHPGIAATNLFKVGGERMQPFLKPLLHKFFQAPEMGVLPTLYAATEGTLKGGEYIGPDGRGNRKGNPTIEVPAKGVYDEKTMKKLWDVSEKLTGVMFDFS
ncbi:oxidoreductase [Domibacillus sp. A3M-37]|uniref:oxidoreductase n=1 Tax=Domibacillus sp. A3M-37 TaxID=2962037 RepID=UPI0020B6D7E6|nr:oxidoreductase [Domibacillus sp. A3M-37]MCP3763797.1 oxidoreductase [Domibacillus sp. A3M-37]